MQLSLKEDKFTDENLKMDSNENQDSKIEEHVESDVLDNDESSNSGKDNNEEVDPRESKIRHNPGWADAMSKILKTNKPKRKSTIVLAKAKKLKVVKSDEEKEVKETFEIDGAVESEEKPEVKQEKSKNEEEKRVNVLRIRKKERDSKGRVKPSVLDKDREKVLSKIATRGVVQLFNAVRQQQKTIESKIKTAGPSDLKQDKVLKSLNKRDFLNVLTGSAKSLPIPAKTEVKDEESKQWSVLRDDFMMSTKLKDWDKDEETVN